MSPYQTELLVSLPIYPRLGTSLSFYFQTFYVCRVIKAVKKNLMGIEVGVGYVSQGKKVLDTFLLPFFYGQQQLRQYFLIHVIYID